MNSLQTGRAPHRFTAVLLGSLALYCVATLIHFVHNAEYLHEYPNMPNWLTSQGVYLSWLTMTAIGLIGVAVYRWRSPRAGLAILAVYAVLGFGGLDHYVVAPASAHSVAMNATILFEATTAGLLLIVVVRLFRRQRRASSNI